MSDIESRLTEIENKLDVLLSYVDKETNRSYSLSEFCKELGISVYKLKQWYELYHLPITAPYSEKKNKPVKYSHEELLIVRKFKHERS